jgi:hypothetical protein
MDAAAIYFLKYCFATAPPKERNELVCGNPDAELIGANFTTSTQNLEKVLEICTLSLNMLVVNTHAQDYAYESRYQYSILCIIDICTRATTNRSYEGELDKATEKKWEIVTKLCQSAGFSID